MLTIFRTPRPGKSDEQSGHNQPKSTQSVPRPRSDYRSPNPYPPKPEPAPAPVQPPRESPVPRAPVANTTIIGKGMIFDGELKGDGSVRIEGQVSGMINIKHEVIVGEGGFVNGNIKSKIVTVLGKLKGNVEAIDKITIDVSGSMIGDIIAPRVVVAEGAVYKGRIDMEQKAREPESKTAPKKEKHSGKSTQKQASKQPTK